eukprot:c30168_g1_i1 orf=1-186(-)
MHGLCTHGYLSRKENTDDASWQLFSTIIQQVGAQMDRAGFNQIQRHRGKKKVLYRNLGSSVS